MNWIAVARWLAKVIGPALAEKLLKTRAEGKSPTAEP